MLSDKEAAIGQKNILTVKCSALDPVIFSMQCQPIRSHHEMLNILQEKGHCSLDGLEKVKISY